MLRNATMQRESKPAPARKEASRQHDAELEALRSEVRELKRRLADAHAKLEQASPVNSDPVNSLLLTPLPVNKDTPVNSASVNSDQSRVKYMREYMRKRRSAKRKDK